MSALRKQLGVEEVKPTTTVFVCRFVPNISARHLRTLSVTPSPARVMTHTSRHTRNNNYASENETF